MKVIKAINNNNLCVLDDRGKEQIVSGKGIGFGKKYGDEVDPALIQKTYLITDSELQKKMISLLREIPEEYMSFANDIVQYIKSFYQEKLNDSLLVTLSDHLAFAIERKKKGKLPANSLWLWSPGKPLSLPSFNEKFGLRGTVISAVDLIKGIGICADMESIDVEGATGTANTNYEGKARATIEAFKSGSDLVYLHFEGPDEHGHRGEPDVKTKSIEYIDKYALSPIWEYLENCGEDFGIMILPDHPTPVRIRTHSPEPVPYIIYSSKNSNNGITNFNEFSCASGKYFADGFELMQYFIDVCN